MYSAYIDRIISEEQAVLLVEELQQDFVVSLEELPEHATAGSWLFISFEGEEITDIVIDHSKSKAKKQTAKNKMDTLRTKKKKSSRFSRDK